MTALLPFYEESMTRKCSGKEAIFMLISPLRVKMALNLTTIDK